MYWHSTCHDIIFRHSTASARSRRYGLPTSTTTHRVPVCHVHHSSSWPRHVTRPRDGLRFRAREGLLALYPRAWPLPRIDHKIPDLRFRPYMWRTLRAFVVRRSSPCRHHAVVQQCSSFKGAFHACTGAGAVRSQDVDADALTEENHHISSM